jgi:hypothetical protein
MSDFLVIFGQQCRGQALLDLLRRPFGKEVPGQSLEFSWGRAAILRDPVSASVNAQHSPAGLFAWVGDLVSGDRPQLAQGLLAGVAGLRRAEGGPVAPLAHDPAFKLLNGAFAILLADAHGAAVITDPLGSVQVYAGRNQAGALMAIGTHPDVVASLTGGPEDIDPVSVFEFVNAGTPCFPHTMHRRVRELRPGRLHLVVPGHEGGPELKEFEWWPFPDEMENGPGEAAWAEQLGQAFAAAVQDRSGNGTVGVTLSGGLDSRLVMAAVPSANRCIGFTFCDVLNREAQIARRVARCYQREWVPLFRDGDYIARTAIDTVKFIGCEGDWVNAHGLGFAGEISSYRPGVVFSGLLMNNNVKGFYAADVARVARWRGLLPPRYEIRPYDYVGELKPFAHGVFADGLLEGARARRQVFLEGHPGLKRQSAAEWLDGYPFSQAPDNTAWVAERRLMPVRLPAMDRRVLEIACRIPMKLKAQGHLFARMAKDLLGRGARIPDANDGVRPGSNHVWRLCQRAARELANGRRSTLRRLGWAQPVPTSWHDYQQYWQKSAALHELIQVHGPNLSEFETGVFTRSPRALLSDQSLGWLYGFRLVQLALWRGVVREYSKSATCYD